MVPACDAYASSVELQVDYHSIPQENKALQSAAIDSIGAYAALASAFVIVAPSAVHKDTGLACNSASYLSRG